MSVQTRETPTVMFSPRRLGHFNLFVGDLERSTDFYTKVCGIEQVFEEAHIPASFLSNGNTHHDLGLIQVQQSDKPIIGRDGHVQVPQGRGLASGLNHFGWEMENEKQLVDAYNRAVESGLDIHRVVDHTLSHSIYIFDPDGNLNEFYADFIVDWRTVFNGMSGEAITGGWDPNAAPPVTEPRYHASFELRRIEDALVHPIRITHAVVTTRSHDRMIAFYRDVAGLDVAYQSPDSGIVCLAGPNAGYACDIALFRPAAGQERAVHHYSYEIASEAELEAAEAALEGAGIAIEKRLDNETKRSFFIKDPDDMRLEFYVARAPDLASIGAADSEAAPYLV
jgi:catechol 2,3-dioxygenase